MFIGIDTTSKRTELALVGISDTDYACGNSGVARLGQGAVVVSSESYYQAESIVSLLDKLLSGANIELCDVKGIGVASGPGSFTGIRNGIATARAIDFAMESCVSTLAIPTLLACAYTTCVTNDRACSGILAPILKANAGEVFCAVYGYLSFDNVDISSLNNGITSACVIPVSQEMALIELAAPFVVSDSKSDLELCGDLAIHLEKVIDNVSPALATLLNIDDITIITPETVTQGNPQWPQSLAMAAAHVTRSIITTDTNAGVWASVSDKLKVRLEDMLVSKSNPVYVKGVNALTLVERGIKHSPFLK